MINPLASIISIFVGVAVLLEGAPIKINLGFLCFCLGLAYLILISQATTYL